MNQEIEKRIVAMYFDNQDFEKNAKQTLDTLGQLKDNLNLEDSVKGFEELDKAGKKLNLSNVKSNISNMKSSLSGFQNVLNKSFTIGTAPVRALENFFGTFQSYVGRFVGFDLASKFVSSLENALRQLTVAPIEAGWSMYESTIDSVKTIMSGTMTSYKKAMSETTADWTYDEEEHMEYVKKNLNELSRYAQATVFSLSDMTNNVGKFTNNNVDLETSVLAMEGIANMTAKAGQGAQQASMAMYNFSQAIGVGKMTSIDWKSIENANIATTELKQTFIDAAVASGKLHKEVTKMADGTEIVKYFQTVDKNGKKLAKNKWIEISAENFRDTLQNAWLDRDTMLNVMKIYSGQVSDLDTLASMGFDINDTELVDQLLEIGRSASEAATQVRTFSKMWDALTEAVQSGWSDSMQLIFGDMTEATEFWTRINDELGSVLDKSANERNTMLHEWRGEVFNAEKNAWEKVDGAYDGREDMLQGIWNIIAAVKALGGAFSSAWREVFGQMDGKKLQGLTKAFSEITEKFNKWLGVRGEDGMSRIEKIQKGLKGVFSILKAVGNVFKTVFGIVKKVAAPLADFFVNLFSDVAGFFDGIGDLNAGQVIAKLREGLGKVWEAIAKLFEPEEIYDEFGKKTGKKKTPIAKFLESTFGSIAKDVKQWFQDNDLAGVWKALEDAWEWLKGIWEKIASWEGWAAIGAFFTNIYTAVRDYFAPKETKRYVGSQLDTVLTDSPFVATIKRIWERIKSVWDSVVGWSGWASIGQFFSDVGGWLTKYYNIAVDFFTKPTENGKTGFINWLEDLKSKLEAAWQPIYDWEGWEQIGMFFGRIGAWINDRANETIDFFVEPTANGETGFTNWLNEILVKLDAFWQPVRDWEGWGQIADFFSDAYHWIEAAAGTAIDFFSEPTENGETGFSNWFTSIVDSLTDTWNSVIDWEGWTAIGQFFTDIGSWITEQFGYVIDWFGTPTDEEGTTGFSAWLASVKDTLDTVWNEVYNWEGWSSIGQFFTDVGSWIQEHFGYVVNWFKEPTDNGKTGFVNWLESFAADVSRIWNIIYGWEGWKKIGQFFSDIFGWIMGLFGGGEETEAETRKTKGGKAGKLSTFKKKVEAAKEEVTGMDKELSFFERILKAIGDFIDSIASTLSGQDMDKFSKFFEALGTFFNGLVDIITKVLDSVGKFLSATAEGGLGAGWDSLGGETQTGLILAGIIAFVGEIVDVLKTRWMSQIDSGESVAHKLFEIGAGLLMLALAFAAFSLIPVKGLITGVAVLALVLIALNKVMPNLAEMAKQNATAPSERVLSKVVAAVEKMGTIAIVMAMLPEIIKAFAEAKKECPDLNGLDIMETLIGIAGAVVVFFAGFALVNKLIGNTKTNWDNSGTMLKIMLWIVGIIAIIAALGVAAHELNGTKTILDGLKDAKEVLIAAGEAIGGLVGGIIGGFIDPIRKALGIQTDEEKIESSMNILESISSRLDYFTPDKIYGINRILSSIGMLSQTVESVPNADKIIGFATSLEPLADGIIRMGVTLAGFTEQDPGIQGLSIDDVEANIYKVTEIMRAFNLPKLDWGMNGTASTAYKFIENIRWLNENMKPSDFEAFSSLSKRLVEAFDKATAPDSEAMIKSAGDLLTNLSNALRLGMGNNAFVGSFDGEPIIDAIVIALSAGEARVSVAVHEMIQNGINKSVGTESGSNSGFETPTIDLSSIITGWTAGVENPFENLLGSGNVLGMLGDTFWGTGGSEDNPTENSLYGMFTNFQEYAEGYEVPDIGSKIAESMVVKDADGNPVDLVTFIQGNLDQMSAALEEADSSFEITIIPSLDWSRLTPEAIQQQLGDMPIELPANLLMGDTNLKMDYSGLFAELGLGFIQDELTSIENAIDDERVAVVNAIDAMGVRIDGVSSAVRSLKLYLDTGALVGGITPYIDLMLGRRAALAARTGVTFP